MTDLTLNLHVRDEYLTVFYNYFKIDAVVIHCKFTAIHYEYCFMLLNYSYPLVIFKLLSQLLIYIIYHAVIRQYKQIFEFFIYFYIWIFILKLH